jgi:hypothetical protein
MNWTHGLILLLLSSWCTAPYAAGQSRGNQRHENQMYPDTQCPSCPAEKTTHDATMLQDSWQKNPNPFRPGSDLRASDIKCSIVEWDNASPKPVLTVVCPPPEVFTPLRVFLKFSWMDAKDVPKDVAKVVAEPRTGTKIQFDRANIKVFLKLSKGAEDSTKEKWMAFNALQGFAIIPSEIASSKH